MSRPVRVILTALLAGLVLLLAGCGGDSETPPADSAAVSNTATPIPEVTGIPDFAEIVEVTVTKDDIKPAGEQIEVDKGQPVVLEIDAEVEGELHVHSTPEQEISYPAGQSQATIVIDRPGVVEVESHTLDKLVVQLEVR